MSDADVIDPALREEALESLLIERGLADTATIETFIRTYETAVGPMNGAKVVAKFVDIVIGFCESLLEKDLSASFDSSLQSFNDVARADMPNQFSYDLIPFLLLHYLADTPVGHYNHFMLKEADEDHDARAVPGVEYLFFQEGIFSTLSAAVVHITARHQPARDEIHGRPFGEGRRFDGQQLGGEVALALVLLVGAVLMLRTVHALNDVDPGFRPGSVLTMRLQQSMGEPDRARRPRSRNRPRSDRFRTAGTEKEALRRRGRDT